MQHPRKYERYLTSFCLHLKERNYLLIFKGSVYRNHFFLFPTRVMWSLVFICNLIWLYVKFTYKSLFCLWFFIILYHSSEINFLCFSLVFWFFDILLGTWNAFANKVTILHLWITLRTFRYTQKIKRYVFGEKLYIKNYCKYWRTTIVLLKLSYLYTICKWNRGYRLDNIRESEIDIATMCKERYKRNESLKFWLFRCL